MPTLEAEQLEIESLPERSPLGKACKKYLDLKEKMKDIQEDIREAAGDVMSLMRDKEGDPSVRFNGWEFEIDTPEMKLVCHALKGKPESLRKAA
jgi:hypothetical protein